jgi:WD40 repeat protein
MINNHFVNKFVKVMIPVNQFAFSILVIILYGCSAEIQTKTTITEVISTTSTSMPVTTETRIINYKLPRSLYYLASDLQNKFQIFKINPNTFLSTQITDEVDNVLTFDVSSVDGTIVFNTGGRIILMDANNNREEIINNSDSENRYTSVRFSPDGKVFAYARNGNIYFYSLETKESILQISKDTVGYSLTENSEFSPDGKKLLINHPNIGIFDIDTKKVNYLHKLPLGSKGEIFGWCRDVPYWSSDSTQLYFANTEEAGGCGQESGLFRFGLDGIGDRLFPENPNDPEIKGATIASLWQDTNGDIIYLYSSTWPSFTLVRSSPDDIKNHIMIRPESFYISLIPPKWTPDGNALIIVQTNGEKTDNLTSMILIPIESTLPIETILPDASMMVNSRNIRWGP